MKKVLLAQFWTVHLSHRIQQGVLDYMTHHETWRIAEISAVPNQLKEALNWDVDGVIATVVSDPIAEICRTLGKPCVSTGMEPYPDFPLVDVDNYRAGADAADFFLTKPYEQYAVLGNTLITGHQLRQNGFIDRLASAKKPAAEWHVEIYGATTERTLEMIDQCLAGVDRPTAVYCSDDKSAYFLNVACRRRQIDVPGFIGIMASENSEKFCGLGAAALSSLDLGYHDVGARAAEVLNGLFRGEPPPAKPVLVPPVGIIERASTP